MQNYFIQNSFRQEISRFSASLFLAAVIGALAGCHGGSDTPTTPPSSDPPATPVATAASIQLLVSSPQIGSSGANTVDVTAIAVSSTGQAVSGRTVLFSRGTDDAFFQDISGGGVTDTNGLVTARLKLGLNKTNRTITLTASADGATATNSVDVTGTTVTISGNSSLAFNATTTLTFSVKDSAGTAIQNIPVTVTSLKGNTIALAPTTGITDSSGQIRANITATVAGNDTITATAAGTRAAQNLTISSANFAFTAPAAGAQIPLTGAGSTATVTVNWTDVLTPPVGPVSFSTSRGTVSSSSSPLVAGSASVTISSTTAGPAIITASGPTGTPAATLDVIFVATSASTVTVQAVPGTVQFTSGSTSQTNNSSTISVIVRDAQQNLVKNANVSFNIVDPSGGRLTSSTGITDVSGTASVTYVAGGTSSAQNGVSISAAVNSVNGVAVAPVTGTTTLTVSGQSLQVRLGTDNKVSVTAQNANSKTYLAIVTDAAGNPVVGTTVQFTLRPSRYQKGFFVADITNTYWVKNATVTCANEDVNFNGILDLVNNVPGTGEDFVNNNGTLEPGAIASVNASGVTDAGGVATATLTYAKSYSLWTEVTLAARTSVTTNDPPTQQTFFLPGAAEDYTPLTTAPPPIPFGSSPTCANLL